MANLSLIITVFKTFFISLLLHDFTLAHENFGTCITPNKERALCIKLKECTYLYNILVTPPLTRASKFYLSRSQCGFRNNSVLICCPHRHRQPVRVKALPLPSSNATKDLLPDPIECEAPSSNRIFGGERTKIDEFPWMALLEYTKRNNTKGHHCGGSLINSRYVLTAAHCVHNSNLPDNWRLTAVRLGEWNTTTNPDCEIDIRGNRDCAPKHIDIRIESAIPHPRYKPHSRNYANDIALIRLKRNVQYTYFVKPICLPIEKSLRSDTFENVSMQVAGWGKTEKTSMSNVKLKAKVKVVSIEKCRSVYTARKVLLKNAQMCAGGTEGIDSCRGDSGGGLISLNIRKDAPPYNFLAGIISFGSTPCGLQAWPGVYTRVGRYIEWILQNIKP